MLCLFVKFQASLPASLFQLRVLRASAANPIFSVSCSLFAVSLTLFKTFPPSVSLCLCGKPHLFSILQPLCRLFNAPKKVNPFRINQIQPLFPKHPGWGVFTLLCVFTGHRSRVTSSSFSVAPLTSLPAPDPCAQSVAPQRTAPRKPPAQSPQRWRK